MTLTQFWESQPIHDESWKSFIKILPPLNWEHGPWIAGGSARKLFEKKCWKSGDVDIFFKNEEQMLAYTHQLKVLNPPEPTRNAFDIDNLFLFSQKKSSVHQMFQVMETSNAVTYHVETPQDQVVKVQIIKARYSADLLQLWRTFDFTVSCFAADSTHVRFLPQGADHTRDKKLVLQAEQNTANLPLRVLKHMVYGFNPSKELLQNVAHKLEQGDYKWDTEY